MILIIFAVRLYYLADDLTISLVANEWPTFKQEQETSRERIVYIVLRLAERIDDFFNRIVR